MIATTETSSSVEFCVLGATEARVGSREVEIGGVRQRRLLSLLLSRRGEVVENDTLAEYVWDDGDRPANAADAIRTYVSRLRRAFAAAGLDGQAVVVTQSPGYRLSTEAATVDEDRFARLIDEGRSHLAAGDPVTALAEFDDALGLWRGRPFLEFAEHDWIEARVARLEELRRVAVEQRAAARLDLGAHAEVVADLEQLIAEDSLRARPVELLMLALFRSNRQADALRSAASLRRSLGEIGLDFPEAMRELEARIAASDASLLAVATSSDTIRGYALQDRIGEGSFSVVYRSVQPSLGREVAVKQIRAELADQPEFIRRFEAEAMLVASIEHPHIVPLYDFWREPGSAYLIMRWLRGGSLVDQLGERRVDVREAAELAEQVGSALAEAHRRGVVHRDVRPANVFVDEIGNFYLGDFGIAIDTSAPDPDAVSADAAGSTGSDIRGLANVLRDALTGHSEAASHLPPEIERDAAERRLRPRPSLVVTRPDLPPEVEGVLLRASVGGPAEHYATVDAFVNDFVEALGVATAVVMDEGDTAADSGSAVNPYKGLRPFQESDSDDFRGRERLVERLIDRLDSDGATSRLVAAVGPSGSGKSSLVRAGLLPALRSGAIGGSGEWFITTMVPGKRPFEELEAALGRIATSPTIGLAESMMTVDNGIARAITFALPDDGTEMLLVIDQFEELFTLVEDEDIRHAFIDRIVEAATGHRSRIRVVLTIRADHWHRPLQYPELGGLLETSSVAVTAMSADELERAIVDPANRAGVEFSPGLVAEIVTDVHDRPGSLPQMQYILTELFDRRVGDQLSLDLYRELGGVVGGLSTRADELYSACTGSERSAVRWMFGRLVALGDGADDSRRRVRISELSAVPEDVIRTFGEALLLSFDRDPLTREPTVEIAHEALIRQWVRLRRWVDEDRDEIRIVRHLTTAAAEWDKTGRPDTELYGGVRLAAALLHANDHPGELTPLELDFLSAADERERLEREEEQRRVRRLRSLVTAAAFVAVVAMLAGVIALVQRDRADRNAQTAADERAAAEASAELEREARVEADLARDESEGAKIDAEGAQTEALAARDAERFAREDAVIRRMIADAAALRDRKPTLSMLLATEAYDRRPGPDTVGALLSSLQRTDGYLGHIPNAGTVDGGQWFGAIDDRHLVIRTPDSIDVYDLKTRTLIESTPATALSLGPFTYGVVGGGRFATVTAELELVMIDQGSTTPVVVEEIGTVSAVGLGDDGSMVLGRGPRVSVFSAADSDVERFLGTHGEYPVLFAAISPDGTFAATGDEYGNVTIWDVEQARPTWTWTSGAQDRWMADAGQVVVGRYAQAAPVTLGMIAGGPPTVDPSSEGGALLGELAFSRDGRTLYSNAVALSAFDVESGVLRWLVPARTQFQFDELPDGRLISNHQVIENGVVVDEVAGVTPTTRTTATPDGSIIAALTLEGIDLWSGDGDQLIAEAVDRRDHNFASLGARPGDVASFSLATGLSDSELSATVVDAEGASTSLLNNPTRVAFTKSGELVTTYGQPDANGDTIVVRDPDTHEALGPELAPRRWASIQVSDDRRFVAVGALIGTAVDVHDLRTGERLVTLDDGLVPSRWGVYYADFSPDSSRFAASNQATVAVWDTDTWELVHDFSAGPDDNFTEVSFTPDGSELAMWSLRDGLVAYDLDTEQRRTIVAGTVAPLGINNVNGLSFSPDGAYAIVAGDGANLVDVTGGRLIGPPFPTSHLTHGASAAPGARSLVTGTDGHLLTWNLSIDEWPEIACLAAGRNMTIDEWDQFGWPDEPYRATCSQW